jgi:hypothetical protein
MSFRRSLPFILLNIIISAATMLIVLAIWEGTHRIKLNPTPSTDGASGSELANCATSSSPSGKSIFAITNIFGVGDIQKEEVDLKYSGAGSFCMRSWQLVDQRGHRFVFPDYFQFFSGDVLIKIYSRAGTNTPLELYWGFETSIWQSGSKVRLLDAQGKEQASFLIP